MTKVAFYGHLRRLDACGVSRRWVKLVKDEPATLWERCRRGDWLLWLAARSGVDRRSVTLAACACARLALPCVRPGDGRPLLVIETAERWARGEGGVTLDDVRSACREAEEAAIDIVCVARTERVDVFSDADLLQTEQYFAADAAYFAACDVDNSSSWVYAATVVRAATSTDVCLSRHRAPNETLARCADLVREWIRWPEVEAALEMNQA